jgi:selenocysteine lyase/cysteine desulfurase
MLAGNRENVLMRTGQPFDRSRRDFARIFAVGGSAALFAARPAAWHPPDLDAAQALSDRPSWRQVRQQFVMPTGYACLNAANLCPSPVPVLNAASDATRSVDGDPSSQNRAKTHEAREAVRRQLAQTLRVSAEEIVITRNTSESNNIVSSGLDFKPGDEVLIFSDNHPSNHAAWRQKAQRFGFTVKTVDQMNPHPGADYYVDAFRRQLTSATRLIAVTHVTASVGDVMPVRELCQLAREHGALSLVDGAQSFGVLDVDLSDMQPDFYSGSAHKWPCGSKETGVLFVSSRTHDRIKPSIVSLYGGDVGISRTLEAFGQRDEAAIMGFGAALEFQKRVGAAAIEKRARELAAALIKGLKQIDGVRVWTHEAPARSAAIVSFRPGTLDVRRLHQVLYEKDRIVCATRGGADRGGLRFSPHFYNLDSDVERALGAIKRYMATGL